MYSKSKITYSATNPGLWNKIKTTPAEKQKCDHDDDVGDDKSVVYDGKG